MSSNIEMVEKKREWPECQDECLEDEIEEIKKHDIPVLFSECDNGDGFIVIRKNDVAKMKELGYKINGKVFYNNKEYPTVEPKSDCFGLCIQDDEYNDENENEVILMKAKAKQISFRINDIDKMCAMQHEMENKGIIIGDTGYSPDDNIRDLQVLATQVDIAAEYIRSSGFDIVEIKDDIDILVPDDKDDKD